VKQDLKQIPKDVDAYIAASPESSREKLIQLRRIIRATAPQTEEVISYHMPYYRYHGSLVGFAAYKNHVSLFGSLPKELMKDLGKYRTGRGSVQFPLDEPLPVGLITRLIKARIKMNDVHFREKLSNS
jgi:uncharacterized protein YdhG (YjbR/CyaY superfamily)